MSTRRWIVLAMVGAALAVSGLAEAYCRTTTVPDQPDPTVCPARGVPIRWSTRCVSMRLDPRGIPAYLTRDLVHATAVGAAGAWSGVACGSGAPSFSLVILDDRESPLGYVPEGPNTNRIAFESQWADDPFHPPDAAAVTVVTFGGLSATILDTDTDLNSDDFRFVTGNDRTGADLATILGHEFGHVQGLAHSPERSALMWYSVGRGEQRRVPTADDVAGICAIYPPSAPAACDPEVRSEFFSGGGFALVCSSRPRGVGSVALVFVALGVWVGARRRRGITAPR